MIIEKIENKEEIEFAIGELMDGNSNAFSCALFNINMPNGDFAQVHITVTRVKEDMVTPDDLATYRVSEDGEIEERIS